MGGWEQAMTDPGDVTTCAGAHEGKTAKLGKAVHGGLILCPREVSSAGQPTDRRSLPTGVFSSIQSLRRSLLVASVAHFPGIKALIFRDVPRPGIMVIGRVEVKPL